ncbi:geranylgeranylglycerol-phosphate geranylgeranyltransferase [Flavicella sediminum]|uniref:geranylgeranylglycerol-phosphate geranylgeranyltransferase n=1 Tax=Flavicella sediminum TaxID=2585141 RepID=UPI0021D200EA|nr:geranylgeranylglycerol-phosphate geranylgeranyltransferase [Flavicella sediminum]
MLFISQFFLKYFLFTEFPIQGRLNTFQFSLLTLATIFIASGGYIINDIFDIECDRINKPQQRFIPKFVSKKAAYRFYALFSFLGICCGSALSYFVNKPYYSFIFVGISLLLYLYSAYFQKKILIGNFIISILVAANLLLLVFFETENYFQSLQGLRYAYSLALFTFLLNFMREMVKDIEDINGDYNAGMKTLPILLGTKRTLKIIGFLGAVSLYFFIRFVIEIDTSVLWKKCVFVCLIVLPFLYFLFRISLSKKKEEFHKLSTLLKIILGLGLFYILLISF